MNEHFMNVLFVGDIVGIPGQRMLQKHLDRLVKEHAIDVVLVNGENSAPDGRGITPTIVQFLKELGVDLVTTGNHIWAKKEIIPYIATHKDILRPINFPNGCPGVGATIISSKSGKGLLGVINVQGRIFMRDLVGCPFRAVESVLSYVKAQTNCIFIDMHSEATSEKMGIAYYFDGKVSAVVGTHTHVQTADERVLPQGTAYITDVGMGGSLNSMIGMKADIIIKNMLTQMPVKFAVETQGPFVLSAVVVKINTATGLAQSIKRIYIVDTDLVVESPQ